MNRSITIDEEKSRFHFFLDFLKANPEILLTSLSIDSYKTENFKYFYFEIKRLFPEIKLIMNDVSGVLDLALSNLLMELKDIHYIYTCTRIPERSVVLDHMTFLQPTAPTILDECTSRFTTAYQWFDERNLLDRVMFDPGFGFSKTYEENWTLIDGFSSLVETLDGKNIKIPWVIGLSRKSFLRKKCADSPDPILAAEELHKKLLQQFIKQTKTDIYLRVHNPEVVSL
jgi:dihydropteroate synthase